MPQITVRIKATNQVETFEDMPRIRAMIASGMAEEVGKAKTASSPRIETAAIIASQTAALCAPDLYERGPRSRR